MLRARAAITSGATSAAARTATAWARVSYARASAPRKNSTVASRGRSSNDDERERDHHEDRIERVLRHDRSRVERRRHSDGEQSDDERPALRDDSAREQVRGDGRERHEQRVDQLDRAVDGRDRAEERVRRTDQDRIDDAVASGRRLTDGERPARREALRELGVDDLVDHDPRADHVAREAEAHRCRDRDERTEPSPRRNGAGLLTHRFRPHGGAARAATYR